MNSQKRTTSTRFARSLAWSLTEARFTSGTSVLVSVPVLFTAYPEDGNGIDEDWVRKYDAATGSDLRSEIMTYAKNDDGEDEDGEDEDGEDEDGEDEDGEKYGDDFDYAIDQFIQANYRGQWRRFLDSLSVKNPMTLDYLHYYGASDADEYEIVKDAAEDFNTPIDGKRMVDFWNNDERGQGLQAKSMRMLDTPLNGSRAGIEVEFGQSVTADQLEPLLSWVSGQMSDGWGEGYEQKKQDFGDGGLFDFSIHFFGDDVEPELVAVQPTPSDLANTISGLKAKAAKFGQSAGRAAAKAFRNESLVDRLLSENDGKLVRHAVSVNGHRTLAKRVAESVAQKVVSRVLSETRFQSDLKDGDKVKVTGVRGVKSVPFTRRFESLAKYEAWLESNGDDVEIHQVERDE